MRLSTFFFQPKHLALAMMAWGLAVACTAQGEPPTLTHVNNVNAAGNATLHWDIFQQVGTEEFVRNEIKVFDLDVNPLGTIWHEVGPDLISGQLPTGWVMPSFLYNANDLAHCFTGIQVTTDGGIQSVSDPSPYLCSIHVAIAEGDVDGEIDLSWNSPYALSGDAAGGPFRLERLNASTADWDLIAEVDDSPQGGSFTDYPGPCVQLLVYRVRQLASNGEDEHVSNVTDLTLGTQAGDAPVVSHVDVDNGESHVYWSFEATDETLGYIVYQCLEGSGGSIVATIEDPTVTDFLVTGSEPFLASESYQVAAYDCVDDNGDPNPAGAGPCVETVFLNAAQIPCTERAQLNWDPPTGMAGSVLEYIPQYSADGGPWISLDTVSTSVQSIVHEGVPLDALTSYRVLAVGGEGQIAASNLVDITFVYPSNPTLPIIREVSVLDRGRVKILLETDTATLENNAYEFEVWNEADSLWIPLVGTYDATDGQLVEHVDEGLNTDENRYRYRALCYNACGVMIGTSQAVETILLRAYQSTEPGLYENSLIWQPFDGFVDGLDGYVVERKQSSDEAVPYEFLTSIQGNFENHEDDVSDEFDSPGIFCYRVAALEMANGDILYEGSKSNEVCLTEEPIVWIPNAFSPNGDQINDWFPWPPGEANVGFLGNPQNGTPNFEMNVVSRWGTLIFRSESIDEPWDGTQDGKPVAMGIYAVHIRYLDGSGRWRNESLHLSVFPER